MLRAADCENNDVRPNGYPAVLLTLILGLGAQTSFAVADDRQSHAYSIEAQDLGNALRAFALQSQREIFFAPDLTRGKQSHGISGKYEDLTALDPTKAGVAYLAREVLIGSNIVKVVATDDDVKDLTRGDKVIVASKAFNPLIKKIIT